MYEMEFISVIHLNDVIFIGHNHLKFNRFLLFTRMRCKLVDFTELNINKYNFIII